MSCVKNRFYRILITLFLLGVFLNLSAQNSAKKKSNFADKLVFGGNFGASFGTVTVLNLTPQVGYKVSEKTIPGISATYIYFADSRFDYSTSIYGGGAWVRHFLTENLYGVVELESLYGSFYNALKQEYIDGWVPGAFVGAGYAQRVGSSAVVITGLYNVLYDNNYSPYNSPIVLRIGFML